MEVQSEEIGVQAKRRSKICARAVKIGDTAALTASRSLSFFDLTFQRDRTPKGKFECIDVKRARATITIGRTHTSGTPCFHK